MYEVAMKRFLIAVIASALFLTGCAMGPDYRRPKIETPAVFRGDDLHPGSASIADTRWAELFKDPVLTDLISTALSNNYDVRIAAERVLETRAQLGIADSDLFPALDANGALSTNRNSLIGANRFLPAGVTNDVSYTQVGFRLGWELDFWGRVRRLRESARAEYFASEDARRGVDNSRGGFDLGVFCIARVRHGSRYRAQDARYRRQ